MFTKGRSRAFFEGTAAKYFSVAFLVFIGALTGIAVLLSVFRGTFEENSSILSAGEISLSGEWKIMHGDSAEYSQSAFDDSGWETVRLPANTADLAGKPNAIQWLRKLVFIPSNDHVTFNAISLGSIHAADEVYFNGVLIGSTGSMTDEWDINYDKIRVYPLPPGLILQEGWNVVAVRARPVFPQIAGLYKGSLAIGNQFIFNARIIVRDIPLVIVIFVLLLSGIIYTFLSIVRSGHESEYFLLSAFILLMAIFIFLTTQLRFFLSIDFILDKTIKFSVLALLLPVCMRFIYIILLSEEKNGLAGKMSRVMDVFTKWIFIYPLIYILINLIIKDIRVWSALDAAINDTVILIFSFMTLIIIVYLVVKGSREAMILLGGLIVFAATVVHDIAVPEHSLNFTINYSSFGALALVLSMNLIVAYRLQKLTINFGKANAEIADHNRKLEQQVREKTRSLVEANSKLEMSNKELLELNEQMNAAQAKLEKIASTDSLTGLYNRFELDKRLHDRAQTVNQDGQGSFEGFSILYIDIDNFKHINDTFGHQAGDLVLVGFAEILKNTTRSVDIAARYGGDEFIVLMPNTGYEGAKKMADRIVEKLEKTESFRQYMEELKKHPVAFDAKYRLSGSYGIAEYAAGESIDEMIKRADKALYAMKGMKQ